MGKATGAKVNILSKKNHFELDKEIKSDIASGSINWCVGSNHSSFAPQYPDLYTDLQQLLPKEEIDAFVPANIKASTLDGKLVMLPRAQFDVSALYYQKSLYAGRRQEDGLQGEVRQGPDAARHLGGGHRPGQVLRQPAEFLRHAVRRQGRGDQRPLLRNADRRRRRVSRQGRQAGLQLRSRRPGARLVRQPLQGQGRAGRHHQLSLGRSRPGLCLRHLAHQSRLAGLGGFFNDPKSSKVAGNVGVEGRAEGLFRQAHRLVRLITASR